MKTVDRSAHVCVKSRQTSGMIALMDLAIGDVLQELSRLGMRERTIVIFTSDVSTYQHLR